jgi:hypothetical protein
MTDPNGSATEKAQEYYMTLTATWNKQGIRDANIIHARVYLVKPDTSMEEIGTASFHSLDMWQPIPGHEVYPWLTRQLGAMIAELQEMWNSDLEHGEAYRFSEDLPSRILAIQPETE